MRPPPAEEESMALWLRIAGWTLLGAGVIILLQGRSKGHITLIQWGAIIGCLGMVLTYSSAILRMIRKSRAIPPSTRRRIDGAEEDVERTPPGTGPRQGGGPGASGGGEPSGDAATRQP
jgi:hypothetical protein